jgi:hypothetical protein
MTPRTVVISYSHQDEAWKERLLTHLRVLELEGTLDVWDDRRIPAGDDWPQSIEEAIAQADVAILIVSKHFLTSRFIREEELTRILKARSEGGLRVIPLIAEPCAWQEVRALRNIQAWPRDGRPLSAGDHHRIDADLAELAVDVKNGLDRTGRPTLVDQRTAPKSSWLIPWLAGSAILAALFTAAATQWRLSTAVSLTLVTERISFVVRGTRQVIDPDLEFSALTVERCAGVTFEGIALANVESLNVSPARLTCRDPDAKLALRNWDDGPHALGTLGPIGIDPGAMVAISLAAGRVPVLTLELSGHQFTMDVPIEHDLEVVADLMDALPAAVEGTPGLVRYAGTLHDAPRHVVRIETKERGAILVAVLTGKSLGAAFLSRERFPVESVQIDKEALDGAAMTALLADSSLSYLDYPAMPARLIPKDNAIILEQLSEAQVRGLRLETLDAPGSRDSTLAIKVTVEGHLMRGAIGTGDRGHPEEPNRGRWSDPRLTVYDRFMQRPVRLATVATAWAVATFLPAYVLWKRRAAGV